MHLSTLTALGLSIVAFILLGILPSDSGPHGAARLAFCTLAVVSAGFALTSVLRRTPRDRIDVGAGVGALIAAVGAAATQAYIASSAGSMADIGISAAFLLCLLLLIALVGVVALRTG